MDSHEQCPRLDILASTLVTGGAERVIEALAGGLAARGFAVRILCLRAPGEVGAAIARTGAEVVSGIARGRFDPWACVRLARLLGRGRNAALLVLDHHDAVFLGALAGRLAGVRHRLLAVHSTGLWGKRGSFSATDRMSLGAYERVIALAGAHARYLSEREGIPPARIATIPNGIDTERFRPPRSAGEREAARRGLALPAGRFVVSIVAALRPEKNHGMLLEAAARIARTRGDFMFLIVGEGTEEEGLRRRVEELSLEGSVRFLGRREDVTVILAASDAAVLCSHPVVETFPLAVLEAMACGVSVVATDVGAVREMLVDGEEGFIVPPGDAEALAGSLLTLAARPDERERVGRSARQRVVRDFTVERMVEGYAALLDQVRNR
jgi:glycosyltransferase involved in cell wall biosynthesis